MSVIHTVFSNSLTAAVEREDFAWLASTLAEMTEEDLDSDEDYGLVIAVADALIKDPAQAHGQQIFDALKFTKERLSAYADEFGELYSTAARLAPTLTDLAQARELAEWLVEDCSDEETVDPTLKAVLALVDQAEDYDAKIETIQWLYAQSQISATQDDAIAKVTELVQGISDLDKIKETLDWVGENTSSDDERVANGYHKILESVDVQEDFTAKLERAQWVFDNVPTGFGVDDEAAAKVVDLLDEAPDLDALKEGAQWVKGKVSDATSDLELLGVAYRKVLAAVDKQDDFAAKLELAKWVDENAPYKIDITTDVAAKIVSILDNTLDVDTLKEAVKWVKGNVSDDEVKADAMRKVLGAVAAQPDFDEKFALTEWAYNNTETGSEIEAETIAKMASLITEAPDVQKLKNTIEWVADEKASDETKVEAYRKGLAFVDTLTEYDAKFEAVQWLYRQTPSGSEIEKEVEDKAIALMPDAPDYDKLKELIEWVAEDAAPERATEIYREALGQLGEEEDPIVQLEYLQWIYEQVPDASPLKIEARQKAVAILDQITDAEHIELAMVVIEKMAHGDIVNDGYSKLLAAVDMDDFSDALELIQRVYAVVGRGSPVEQEAVHKAAQLLSRTTDPEQMMSAASWVNDYAAEEGQVEQGFAHVLRVAGGKDDETKFDLVKWVFTTAHVESKSIEQALLALFSIMDEATDAEKVDEIGLSIAEAARRAGDADRVYAKMALSADRFENFDDKKLLVISAYNATNIASPHQPDLLQRALKLPSLAPDEARYQEVADWFFAQAPIKDQEAIIVTLRNVQPYGQSLWTHIGIYDFLQGEQQKAAYEKNVAAAITRDIDAQTGLTNKINTAAVIFGELEEVSTLQKYTVGEALAAISSDQSRDYRAQVAAIMRVQGMSISKDTPPAHGYATLADIIDSATDAESKVAILQAVEAETPFGSPFKLVALEGLQRALAGPSDIDAKMIVAEAIHAATQPESKPAGKMFATLAATLPAVPDIAKRFDTVNWVYDCAPQDVPLNPPLFETMRGIIDAAPDLATRLKAADWICARTAADSRLATQVMTRVLMMAQRAPDSETRITCALWVYDRAVAGGDIYHAAGKQLHDLGVAVPQHPAHSPAIPPISHAGLQVTAHVTPPPLPGAVTPPPLPGSVPPPMPHGASAHASLIDSLASHRVLDVAGDGSADGMVSVVQPPLPPRFSPEQTPPPRPWN